MVQLLDSIEPISAAPNNCVGGLKKIIIKSYSVDPHIDNEEQQQPQLHKNSSIVNMDASSDKCRTVEIKDQIEVIKSNDKINCYNNEEEEDDNDGDDNNIKFENKCGWFSFRPTWIQKFMSPKWALFWLCWAGAVQGN